MEDYKKQQTRQLIIATPILIVMMWVMVTSFIQAIKNPELTQTELILKVPESFICNFN